MYSIVLQVAFDVIKADAFLPTVLLVLGSLGVRCCYQWQFRIKDVTRPPTKRHPHKKSAAPFQQSDHVPAAPKHDLQHCLRNENLEIGLWATQSLNTTPDMSFAAIQQSHGSTAALFVEKTSAGILGFPLNMPQQLDETGLVNKKCTAGSNCLEAVEQHGTQSVVSQRHESTNRHELGLLSYWPAASDLSISVETPRDEAGSALGTALASGDVSLVECALSSEANLCSPSLISYACSLLSREGIPLSRECALELIDIYGRHHRGDLAVDLWQGQCTALQVSPSDLSTSEESLQELYCAALVVSSSSGDLESAVRAARSAKWHAPSSQRGQDTLMSIARWLARRQELESALQCYNSVLGTGGLVDLLTRKALIIASVRCTDMTRAATLFNDLLADSIRPDCGVCSAMICGYCNSGNMEEAMACFRLMKEQHIARDVSLFDTLLNGCLWTHPELLEHVLADMEAERVCPSSTTLSILVRHYGKKGDVDQAVRIFSEFPERYGLDLDIRAHETLISVCLNNSRLADAEHTLRRLFASGGSPSARTYEALIVGFLRHGSVEQAVHLIDRAMGLKGYNDNQSANHTVQLENKVLQDVLWHIGRHQKAARIGVPLITRLQQAQVELPEQLVEAMMKAAQTIPACWSSAVQKRQEERQSWRNFEKRA